MTPPKRHEFSFETDWRSFMIGLGGFHHGWHAEVFIALGPFAIRYSYTKWADELPELP